MQQISEILTNTKTLNTSVSEVKNTNTKTLEQVHYIANKISLRLNNPSRLKYYYKVAWRLPESVIWVNLEQALTGRNPAKYFSFLSDIAMKP